MARDMLVKELRRRDQHPSNGSGSENNECNSSNVDSSQERDRNEILSLSLETGHGASYHPTEETPGEHFSTPSAPLASSSPNQQFSSSTNNNHINDGIDVDDIDTPPLGRTDSLSFLERMQYHFAQIITWYHSQSEDRKTLVKVAFFFILLYVALGGRFGLEYALGNQNTAGRHGNYGEGNAYDRYHHRSSSLSSRQETSIGSSSSSGYNDQYLSDNNRYYYGRYGTSNTAQRQSGYSNPLDRQKHVQSSTSSGYNDRTNAQNDRYYSRYEDQEYYERPRRSGSVTSFHMVGHMSIHYYRLFLPSSGFIVL